MEIVLRSSWLTVFISIRAIVEFPHCETLVLWGHLTLCLRCCPAHYRILSSLESLPAFLVAQWWRTRLPVPWIEPGGLGVIRESDTTYWLNNSNTWSLPDGRQWGPRPRPWQPRSFQWSYQSFFYSIRLFTEPIFFFVCLVNPKLFVSLFCFINVYSL